MDAVVKELGDRLAGLSGIEAGALGAYLREAHGIEPAVTSAMPIMRDPAPEPPPGPSATVDVVLKSAGDKKINVLKIVRQVTGLGLKEAKETVEGTPKTIKAGVDRADGEKLKKELEEQGAVVELV